MVTMMQFAINEIRYCQNACKRDGFKQHYATRIQEYWQEIQLYRSSKTVTAYCAKGLFEVDIIYLSMEDIKDWVDDMELEIGVDVIVETIQINTRDIGRLEYYEI